MKFPCLLIIAALLSCHGPLPVIRQTQDASGNREAITYDRDHGFFTFTRSANGMPVYRLVVFPEGQFSATEKTVYRYDGRNRLSEKTVYGFLSMKTAYLDSLAPFNRHALTADDRAAIQAIGVLKANDSFRLRYRNDTVRPAKPLTYFFKLRHQRLEYDDAKNYTALSDTSYDYDIKEYFQSTGDKNVYASVGPLQSARHRLYQRVYHSRSGKTIYEAKTTIKEGSQPINP